MSDRPSHNLEGLDIDLARRIDEVCRRFEADWRAGRRPRIEDYLVDVTHEGRPALRAELIAARHLTGAGRFCSSFRKVVLAVLDRTPGQSVVGSFARRFGST